MSNVNRSENVYRHDLGCIEENFSDQQLILLNPHKALDEIYKVYMLLHRSDLNISEIFRQFFLHFFAKICKI